MVLFVLFQADLFGKIIQLAIHAHPDKASLGRVGENLLMLALFAPDHRRQNLEAGPLRQLKDAVYNLVDGLLFDLLAALGAVGHAGAGPQKAQIVVDLRHRAHGRAGVFGGGLLVDGDRRGQAVNGVHIRLVHLAQEHPGVARQGFHIPPLPLGIDGVKGQGGFARPGQAGENHQLVSWDGEIHIF